MKLKRLGFFGTCCSASVLFLSFDASGLSALQNNFGVFSRSSLGNSLSVVSKQSQGSAVGFLSSLQNNFGMFNRSVLGNSLSVESKQSQGSAVGFLSSLQNNFGMFNRSVLGNSLSVESKQSQGSAVGFLSSLQNNFGMFNRSVLLGSQSGRNAQQQNIVSQNQSDNVRQLQILNRELDNEKQANSHLLKHLSDSDSQLAGVMNQLTGLKGNGPIEKIRVLRHDFNVAQNRLQEAQRNSNGWQNRFQTVQGNLANLRTQLQNEQHNSAGLRRQLQREQNNSANLRTQLQNARKDLGDLDDAGSILEVVGLMTARDSLLERLQNLKKEVSTLNFRIKRKEKNFRENSFEEEDADELDECCKKLGSLKEQIGETEGKLRDLDKEMDGKLAPGVVKDIVNDSKQLRELKSVFQWDDIRAHIELDKKELNKIIREKMNLDKNLERINRERDRLSNEVENAKEENKTLQKQLSDKDKQVNDLSAEFEATKGQISGLAQIFKDSEKSYKTQAQELDKTNQFFYSVLKSIYSEAQDKNWVKAFIEARASEQELNPDKILAKLASGKN